MASPANPLECVNFADLYALVGPESSDVNNWSDAAALASELGSDTTFPDLSLDISAPGAESGTYGSFIEIVLDGIYGDRLDAGLAPEADPAIRNYPGQADDNIIIQGVEGSDGAFGYVGFAFAEEAGDQIKELAVSEEPGGECVLPTAETIADNSYPISRPLYIYVNNASIADNPAVAEYVDFYLGEGYSAVEEVGYVNLDDGTLADTVSTWETARG
jgi:phosphate transport system substrate-binding protein